MNEYHLQSLPGGSFSDGEWGGELEVVVVLNARMRSRRAFAESLISVTAHVNQHCVTNLVVGY